ncbi:hypothetical protein [uncultured Stenotrophomonas sp.]|uniref:hypothetical protein n=1 Tax=uncultured Stenotrophomonas sp. TaxID=165438 RepID=UPI0025D756E8|nr:hypothetical protein [uncultured Stenotrophomonas sp.]
MESKKDDVVGIKKADALSYIRSELSVLEQMGSKEEFLKYKARVEGELLMMLRLGIISNAESQALGEELSQARERAAAKLGQ